jgi:arsenite methyltransferase
MRLKAIPDELIRRDYGCGDPAKYVQTGDHVLDLGSGGGKICYIASQVVGPEGQVTGVDMNDDMLVLARQFQGEVTENIGWDNVSFCKGRIQDLKLDLDQLEEYLQTSPANNANSWVAAEQQANTLRHTSPMIANECVDVVVSNCVLNLVKNEDRIQLFNEIFRVLKPGGRAVISDIVSNGPVPQHLQDDATLWSGCISGAFEEHAFANAFTNAGFVSVEILVRQNEPWQTVEGIEFRSVTIRAWKHYKSQIPDVIDLSDDGCCDPNSNCC